MNEETEYICVYFTIQDINVTVVDSVFSPVG